MKTTKKRFFHEVKSAGFPSPLAHLCKEITREVTEYLLEQYDDAKPLFTELSSSEEDTKEDSKESGGIPEVELKQWSAELPTRRISL